MPRRKDRGGEWLHCVDLTVDIVIREDVTPHAASSSLSDIAAAGRSTVVAEVLRAITRTVLYDNPGTLRSINRFDDINLDTPHRLRRPAGWTKLIASLSASEYRSLPQTPAEPKAS